MSKMEAIQDRLQPLPQRTPAAEGHRLAMDRRLQVDRLLDRAENRIPHAPDFLRLEELFRDGRLRDEGFLTRPDAFSQRVVFGITGFWDSKKFGGEPVEVVTVTAHNAMLRVMPRGFEASLEAHPGFVQQLPENEQVRKEVLGYARGVFDRKSWRMLQLASFDDKLTDRQKRGFDITTEEGVDPVIANLPLTYGEEIAVSWEEIFQQARFEAEATQIGVAKTLKSAHKRGLESLNVHDKEHIALLLAQGSVAISVAEYIIGGVEVKAITVDPHFVDVPLLGLDRFGRERQESVQFTFPDGARFPLKKAA